MADQKHFVKQVVQARVAFAQRYGRLRPPITNTAPTFERSRAPRTRINRRAGPIVKAAAKFLWGNTYTPATSLLAQARGIKNRREIYNFAFGKKMSYHKRRYKKRKYNASSTARLALSKVRKLERKIEPKILDVTAGAFATVTSSGSATDSLCGIAQGDGLSTRDGLKVSPFFLKVKLLWAGVALGVNDAYRTIIFIDQRQQDSVIPGIADVLQGTAPFGVLAMYNSLFRGRFKILFDHVWTGATDPSIYQNFYAAVSIKLTKNLLFSGSAATTVNKNGIYMFSVSNLTANLPSMSYTSRLFYNDL